MSFLRSPISNPFEKRDANQEFTTSKMFRFLLSATVVRKMDLILHFMTAFLFHSTLMVQFLFGLNSIADLESTPPKKHVSKQSSPQQQLEREEKFPKDRSNPNMNMHDDETDAKTVINLNECDELNDYGYFVDFS